MLCLGNVLHNSNLDLGALVASPFVFRDNTFGVIIYKYVLEAPQALVKEN